jgi:ligand-binding sensor domain-containing protein
VRDIVLTEEGGLFVSVARQGVAGYSLGRVKRYGPGQGLPDRDIYSFGLDAGGRVWACGRGGISTWDGSGWTPLRIEGIPLGGRDYTALAHDPEGGAYLGASDGSMIYLGRDSYMEKRLPSSGPERQISLIAGSGRSLYLAGRRAVYRYDGGFTPIGLPGSWFEGAVTGLVPGQGGRLWLSTRFGILHHTGRGWEVFDRRQGLPTEHFTCAAAGSEGELWFGSFDSGVLRLTAGGWVHYRRKHGLPDERISSMIADRSGTVWVSTLSGKVASFDGEEWAVLDAVGTGADSRMIPAADSIFMEDPSVRFLSSTGAKMAGTFPPVLGRDGSGRCMVCSPEGIFLQSEAGWRVLDTPLHRSGARPTALMGAIDGSIWLATRGEGVYVLADGRWLQVGRSGRLGSDHVLAVEQDASGVIWLGTRTGGVTRYSGSRH